MEPLSWRATEQPGLGIGALAIDRLFVWALGS
jgi:hypothetical protein